MASRSSDKDGDSVHTASEVPLTPRTNSPDRRCSSSDTSKSTYSLTRRISSKHLCCDCLGIVAHAILCCSPTIQGPWIKIPLTRSPGQKKRAGFPDTRQHPQGKMWGKVLSLGRGQSGMTVRETRWWRDNDNVTGVRCTWFLLSSVRSTYFDRFFFLLIASFIELVHLTDMVSIYHFRPRKASVTMSYGSICLQIQVTLGARWVVWVNELQRVGQRWGLF